MKAASEGDRQPCPYCGELITYSAKICRFCNEYLDADLAAAERRSSTGDRMLMPVDRPLAAILAGYLGLFSLIPFPLFNVPAIISGVIALKQIKNNPQLIGRGRAYFGIIMGTLSTLVMLLGIISICIAHLT